MHRLIQITLILLLPVFSAYAQAAGESLDEIRQWYVETESKLGQCAVYEDMRWNAPGDPAGYLADVTGFFDKDADDWIKITEKGATDGYSVHTEYFLKDGDLFFVFAKGIHASEKQGIYIQYERRFYFAYGEIIKYLFKEQETASMEYTADFRNTGSSKGDPAKLDAISFIDRLTKLKSALK